jgi:TonB family protein
VLQLARTSCLALLLFAFACSPNASMPGESVADPACKPFVLPFPPDIEPPRALEKVRPRGPFSGKLDGYVCIQSTLNTEGKIVDIKVVDTDNQEFASVAVSALSQWRYSPAMRNGVAVEVRLSHSFAYHQARN